jgi:transposase
MVCLKQCADCWKKLNDHLKELDRQVNELELQIKLWHKENDASRTLEAIPGVGPITASAMVATVGNATEFKDSRQLAAWLGLVPKQHASGGKQLLLGISKRGDRYLRTLLIHGARALIRFAEKKADPESWLRKLITRRNKKHCGCCPGKQERSRHLGIAHQKNNISPRSHYGNHCCSSLIVRVE